MTPKERDEFDRMRVSAEMERARAFVTQYEDHQRHFRRQIEEYAYELGKLDERLGGRA